MNTAVINIRTEVEVKKEAKRIAGELGMSLSTTINLFLKQFVRRRGMLVSLEEKPNAYFRGVLKQAEKNIREGKISPAFDNVDEAIKWLKK